MTDKAWGRDAHSKLKVWRDANLRGRPGGAGSWKGPEGSWRQWPALLCSDFLIQSQPSLVWVGVVHLEGQGWDEPKARFLKEDCVVITTQGQNW